MAGDSHPWRELQHSVKFFDCRDGRLGAWDPDTGTIWIARGLKQAERRCTLTHESIHAERGDEPGATAWHDRKQERAVEIETARRLIPLHSLTGAMLWTDDLHELAEHLWVDVDVLRDRLDNLTDDENEHIEARLYAAERWIA